MRNVAITTLFLISACRGIASDSTTSSGEGSPMLERRSDGVLIASAESLRKIAGYVVDSIFPPAEALRRFRAASGTTVPVTLVDGDSTIRGLFTGYVETLRARDSAAVLRFALTRSEYAWLYYDGSPEQQAGLVPQTAWALMESRSNVGLGRAASKVSELGALRVVSAMCVPTTVKLPAAEVLGPCTVVVESTSGVRTSLPLGRTVLRRDGRVKLVSFANDL